MLAGIESLPVPAGVGVKDGSSPERMSSIGCGSAL